MTLLRHKARHAEQSCGVCHGTRRSVAELAEIDPAANDLNRPNDRQDVLQVLGVGVGDRECLNGFFQISSCEEGI